MIFFIVFAKSSLSCCIISSCSSSTVVFSHHSNDNSMADSWRFITPFPNLLESIDRGSLVLALTNDVSARKGAAVAAPFKGSKGRISLSIMEENLHHQIILFWHPFNCTLGYDASIFPKKNIWAKSLNEPKMNHKWTQKVSQKLNQSQLQYFLDFWQH